MLYKAIKGSGKYWSWIIFLLALIGIGFACYMVQWRDGLIVTGMGRDVSWGFYIGQLTYFVGVAAGGVMVVLPYYIHDYKAFGRITILGEFLAVGAIVICVLFVFVDLGNLPRVNNVMLYLNQTSI
jgi:Ni/Fe-hydrogenase subunit HybB-like protein